MQEIGKLTGTIKMFNGQFGFIKSDTDDIYFHKSDVAQLNSLGVGDLVSFCEEPSIIKKDSRQAKEIQIIQKNSQPVSVKSNRYPDNIGEIGWYNKKGFGLIKNTFGEYFVHISNIRSKPKLINEGDICIFNIVPSKRDRRKKDAVSVIFLKGYPLTQELVNRINAEIISLGTINDNIKYKNLTKLLNIVKPISQRDFVDSIEITQPYRFSLWLDDYIEEIDFDLVATTLFESTSYLFQKIFARLKSEIHQSQVLSLLLDKWDNIDSPQKYEKVKTILGLKELAEQAKINFLASTFTKSDNERRFLLWSEKYVEEVNLETLAEKMIGWTSTTYSNPFQNTFIRLNIEHIQLQVLSLFLNKLGNIDSIQKYEKVKAILGLKELPEQIKKDFLHSSFTKSDSERKFLLWYEGLVYEFDVQYIISGIVECKFKNYSYPILFSRVSESTVKTQIINEVFKRFEDIHAAALDYKEIKKIFTLDFIADIINPKTLLAFLSQISQVLLTKPAKNKFAGIPLIKLLGVRHQNEIAYVSSNLSLFPSEFHEQIESFYHRNDYYRGFGGSTWQHTRIYEDIILCIEYILKSKILSDKVLIDYYNKTDEIDYITELEYLKSFKELHLVLGSEKKDDLIHSLITSFIGDFQSTLKGFAKSIKEEALLNLLKNIKYLDERFLDVFLEKELNDFNIPVKLKLWVYGVTDYFDFNQFCFYYFTLNTVERSIFNKKAKAEMGATLKQAMLKQREPWEFVKSDSESNINKYSATWRSIWFNEGGIRFCIDTNCNFSRAFSWDFSEEKFNLLFDYISGRRLKDLTIWVKDNFIIKVEGLEELEEVIWKVQIQKEVETGVGIGMRSKSGNRIPINMILRNQCIQLLNQFQLNELEPTRVLEKTFNLEKGGLTVDISLLYSIPISKNEIAIVWESLELEKSKATHIFKCSRDEYREIFSDVEFYLQSKSKVRSSLNSNNSEDVERQKKMKYLCRIDHDNFDFSKWEKSLSEALPELKSVTSNIILIKAENNALPPTAAKA